MWTISEETKDAISEAIGAILKVTGEYFISLAQL